jgi:hypothetical protein
MLFIFEVASSLAELVSDLPYNKRVFLSVLIALKPDENGNMNPVFKSQCLAELCIRDNYVKLMLTTWQIVVFYFAYKLIIQTLIIIPDIH